MAVIGCCAGWVCGGDVTAASLKAAATPDKTVTGLPGSATLRISAAQVREGRGQNVNVIIKHITRQIVTKVPPRARD